MKLSTRGRYGTRALLELALQWGRGPIPLKVIAQNQDIPEQYLAHLVAPLVDARVIKSTRGAKGGLELVRHPRETRLSDVMPFLEGSLAPVECVDAPATCSRAGVCATRDVWCEVERAIAGVLASITLQDLADKERLKAQSLAPMFEI